MRLNKSSKRGFVGPLCGVMALGIIGLGITCPYLDGAHAVDEDSFHDFVGECSVEGSTQTLEIERGGYVVTNGVVIGRLEDDRSTKPNGSDAPLYVNMPDLKDGEVQYEYPQLVCKNSENVEFYVNVRPTREAMISGSTKASEFEFTITATKTDAYYDTAGRDAEGMAEFDVNVKTNLADYEAQPVEGADIFQFLTTVKDFVQITRPTTDQGLENVLIEVNPGNFASNYTTFDVWANRGYEIHVTADDPDLTGTDGNSGKIESITDVTASTQFGDNKWGYSIDKDSGNVNVAAYRPITSTMGTAALTEPTGTAGTDSTYRFTCGAKVGTNLPADEYSTTVTISAVIPASAAAVIPEVANP